VGSQNTTDEIVVSQCSVFSSFLPIHSFMQDLEPPSKPVRRESVQIRMLDSLVPSLGLDGQTLWLKSDTQGFELQVLRGANDCLTQFRAVQLEMSIKPVYAGQPTFETMVAHMRERLSQVATTQLGEFWVDGHMRNIPDHYHAHARPKDGFFGFDRKR